MEPMDDAEVNIREAEDRKARLDAAAEKLAAAQKQSLMEQASAAEAAKELDGAKGELATAEREAAAHKKAIEAGVPSVAAAKMAAARSQAEEGTAREGAAQLLKPAQRAEALKKGIVSEREAAEAKERKAAAAKEKVAEVHAAAEHAKARAQRAAAMKQAAEEGSRRAMEMAGGSKCFTVFISFRVREAETEALALKAALEALGYSTFCSSVDIPIGQDWIRTISTALLGCQLFVVLATATYGSKGTDAFATGEELAVAKRKNKILYVVPMADSLEDPSTQVILGTTQMGKDWSTPPHRVPPDLLNDLVGVCDKNGVEKATQEETQVAVAVNKATQELLDAEKTLEQESRAAREAMQLVVAAEMQARREQSISAMPSK